MALFLESDLRRRAKAAQANKTAGIVINEHVNLQESMECPDIFLSHAFDDRELLLGIVATIEDLDYKVYLDWRDDPKLDRNKVTAATADVLRRRMKSSRCLFYATTVSESDSKWMPWELGFKDGDNTRVAILPVMQSTTCTYTGREYMSIYPYVDLAPVDGGSTTLWINRSPNFYVHFEQWLTGKDPTKR